MEVSASTTPDVTTATTYKHARPQANTRRCIGVERNTYHHHQKYHVTRRLKAMLVRKPRVG